MSEPSKADKNVFGADTQLHPVTEMPLENGIGAASDEQQALNHCDVIEKTEGKQAADKMRAKVKEHHRKALDPVVKAEHAVKRAQDHVDTVKARTAAEIKTAEDHLAARNKELDDAKAAAAKAAKPPPAAPSPAPAPPPAATKPVLASVPPSEPAPAPMVPVPQKGE